LVGSLHNRQEYAEDIDPEVFPPHKFLKSVHNTVIEGFWNWLKDKCGVNIKDHILRGQEEHFFNPADELHAYSPFPPALFTQCSHLLLSQVFYWVFVPLVQAELNGFQEWWNQHRVRTQHEKNMPSGHVPSNTFANPGAWGGIDCGIKVPREKIQALRSHLEQEGGSRSSHLDFVSVDFSALATLAHSTFHLPSINWQNSWHVFGQLVDAIQLVQGEL
jgi:hypothetical protein